jgi:hypothetical protein
MARTIEQIYEARKAAVAADATLSPILVDDSNVAEFEHWLYVTSVADWAVENGFDFHKAEVLNIIAKEKAHTLKWYSTKAKAFQYGVTLPADTDVYAVVPPVDTGVLIVESAAVVEYVNLLRIKVAKGTPGALSALSGGQLSAFAAYMERIKDAGVRLLITSGAADTLFLRTQIFYDALVIGADGKRLDGTNDTPVEGAINAFLAALPFNGLFVANSLLEAIQAVEGMRICYFSSIQASYASTMPVGVPVEYIPDAGYMALDSTYFNTYVTYTAHGEL